ncbi:Mu transposase C-terminal domain-containing protein [Poseidonocella sp. HB161398]|uniref:Mu transposase C-terminal domain-containing protein n=1 Tax=Poseidonocella sp. HB161398 TaxID=2320855 RepID=UPI0014863B45|nr:Mu transposase C-terminal domain-containing protein [Poseidonocella sp. HB161398]
MTNQKERVLWIESGSLGHVSIALDSSDALPEYVDSPTTLELLESGQLLLLEDPWAKPIIDSRLPPKYLARRDEAWKIIQPIVLQQPSTFDPEIRSALVKEASKKHKTSRQRIYRFLRRYWQRGMTVNALLPDYDNTARRGESKVPKQKKRGRPEIIESSTGNIGEVEREQIKNIATEYCTDIQEGKFAKAYDKLIRQYYVKYEIDPDTGQQVEALVAPQPSMAQFRYWISKDHRHLLLKSGRDYRGCAAGIPRSKLGISQKGVIGPSSKWQIDATIADIYLCSANDRDRFVGRPTLYFVSDVFSLMIVGFHVSFESASWVGASSALVNAVASKDQQTRRLKIKITEDEWPSGVLPDVLLADCGEVKGKQAELLARNFGIRVENTPAYRPDLKGIVEKRFDLIQSRLGDFSPGYIPKDYIKKKRKGRPIDGHLNIDELKDLLTLLILEHNCRRSFKDYPRTADMISQGIEPIPIKLWHWGIQNRTGNLRQFSAETVQLSLLPEKDASVTDQGIYFNQCFYSSPILETQLWPQDANKFGRKKIKVSYDPNCMDTIWVHGKSSATEFIPCTLAERSIGWKGLSMWEIGQLRYLERKIRNSRKDSDLLEKIKLSDMADDIVSAANYQYSKSIRPGVSNAKRLQEIKENRITERERLKKEQSIARIESSTPAAPTRNSPHENEPDDTPSVRDFESRFLGGEDND